MKIISEYEMSKWAVIQCQEGSDTEEMRNLITTPMWIYCYCCRIKFRQEMRDRVDDEDWNKILNKYHFKFMKDIHRKTFIMVERDMTELVPDCYDHLYFT